MCKNRFTFYSQLVLLTGWVFLLQSCRPTVPDSPAPAATTGTMNDLNVQPGFGFATTGDVTFRVRVLTNQDKPMAGVPVSVYGMPGDQLLVSGVTQADGTLNVQHSVGNHFTEIDVRTTFPGLPNSQTIPLTSQTVDVTLGGSHPISYSGGRLGSVPDSANVPATSMLATLAMPPLATLGTWNNNGVPNYLTASPDPIDPQFYQDVSASLPESVPLTRSHPSYLFNSAPSTLYIKERAEVWVTFVHEGAGWLNTLGFYTFDANTPPQKVEDIKTPTIIFPNVSFAGSGGGLISGHKVKLGIFDAGTSIGFFLLGNAFSNGKVGSGYYAHFSHSNLNVEKSASIQRHVILLDDSRSNRFLLGFEDVSRENTPISCDNDFNDAVFYVTSNPITAIDPAAMPKMDTQKDTDGDGASDTIDEYPTDPKRAFNSYTPAKNTFGTLAYEDLWPAQGDYDFNDLVLNYNFQEVLNASNQVVEVQSKLVPRAIGATLHNGWGFELPIAPAGIRSVTGNKVTGTYTTLGANRAESGGNKAVVVAFEDAFECLKQTSSNFINTIPGEPTSTGDTLSLNIQLTTPVASAQWMSPPYNPFLMVNKQRGREIHFVDNKPTAKATLSLFGTQQDRSNTQTGAYYKNQRGLPWALNIPVSFDYPVERKELTEAYKLFRAWAESGGQVSKDWYMNKAGYRNAANVYTK